MKNKYCQLWLTVGTKDEANKIAKKVLQKRLVACVRQIPVSSGYRWRGQIDHADEILLQMESRQDLFSQVEAEVTKLHTYHTFILEAAPLTSISKSAQKWLNKELSNGK